MSLTSVLARFDNGGYWYNLFARSNDGEITHDEVNKAGGFVALSQDIDTLARDERRQVLGALTPIAARSLIQARHTAFVAKWDSGLTSRHGGFEVWRGLRGDSQINYDEIEGRGGAKVFVREAMDLGVDEASFLLSSGYVQDKSTADLLKAVLDGREKI